MRTARYFCYFLAVAFFALVQAKYIARQNRYEKLGSYTRAITDFLGLRNQRHRYLLIYRQGKVKGYTALKVKRLLDRRLERYKIDMEAVVRLLPVLKQRGNLELVLSCALGDSGLIEWVEGGLIAFGKKIFMHGKRKGSYVLLRVGKVGTEGTAILIPAELGFGGPVFPLPPLSGLRAGEERKFNYFDPITQRQAVVKVKVLSSKRVEVAELMLEGYTAEVVSPVGRFKVTASATGDVLNVRGPGGISLKRVTEAQVRAQFSDPWEKFKFLKRH